MAPGIPTSFIGAIVCIIVAAFAPSVTKSKIILRQDAGAQRNKCAISETLKPTKTVQGTYTKEATNKNVEGAVVLCVTVDAHGRVTDVTPLSGPPELLQASVEAARQWQFEAPPKAPASTQIEMTYSMTKACPEGKGSDVGDIVVTAVPSNAQKAGDLKILDKLIQPRPPYPETIRVERRRGQIYLSVVVNPDGNLTDVRIVKSFDERLDKSTLDTVRMWRFKVSPEDGKPTAFFITLSFRIPCFD
jgi:TonB family protein